MATNYEKQYIGKGKQVDNYDIIRVVLPVEGLDQAVFEKNGARFLSFEIARLQKPDKFGRTHTCYFSVKKQETPAKPAKKGKKATAKTQASNDDLQF